MNTTCNEVGQVRGPEVSVLPSEEEETTTAGHGKDSSRPDDIDGPIPGSQFGPVWANEGKSL